MARKAVVDFEIRGANGINTVKQLEDRVKVLRKEWRNAGDEASRALKFGEFQKANIELQRHRGMIREVGGAWAEFKKSFATVAPGVFGGNLMTMGLQAVLSLGRQFIQMIPEMISRTGKLDDSLADVMKTTKLSKSEVKELNKEFKNLDTRTSREELRKLATEAGKLGKESKRDVLEFVSAADKINVALKEDLGADGVGKIGKITQTFDLEKLYGTEKAMLKVGSAVNALGSASSANEKNLVEFTFRTQGLASAANISVPDILGYAAVLDIAGQSMEVGATVTNKLFIALGQDVPKFAKLAKMGVADFAKLLQNDANEALIRVLENVKGNNKGLLSMADMLKKLGLDGQESISVVSALANRTQQLREQQALGNEEFRKGTSIVDEFNIKNNTTAAILEKISHWWTTITETGSGFWDSMIRVFARLTGVLTSVQEELGQISERSVDIANRESKLKPLIKRYDELKGVLNKSNEEQEEMRKLITNIADIVPTAATAWDAYGNVAAVSLERVNNLLAIQKKELRDMTEKGLRSAEDEIPRLQQKMKQIQADMKMSSRIVSDETGRTYRKDISAEETANMQLEMDNLGAQLKQLQDFRKEARRDLRDWGSKFNMKSVISDTSTTTTTTTDTVTLGDGNLGKGREKEADKYKRVEEELQREIRKLRNQTEVEMLQGKERELRQVEGKYAELKLKAVGHADELKALTELEEAEKAQITTKYEAKVNEAVAKMHEDRRREQMTAQEREIVQAMDKYEKLLEVVGDNEEKIKEIVAQETAEIEAIRKKYAFQGIDVITQATNELERKRFEADLGVDTQQMAGALDPQAANIRKLEIEQEYLAAQYLLYQTFGEERLDLATQWMENEQKLNLDRAALTKRIDDEIKSSTWALADARNQAWASGIGAMRGFFKQSSGMYKALFLAEKALAIADVIQKGIRERAAIRLAYAGLGPIGIVAGETQAAVSRIRTITSVAEIAAQGFAEIAFKKDGGFTDIQTMYGPPSGYVSNPTLFALGRRSYIAGEAGEEFVINNNALQNPVIADFARMIDVVQKSGNYGALSAGASGGGADISAHIIGLRGDIRQLIQIQERNGAKPVIMNYRLFEDFEDDINLIRASVSA